MMRCRVEHARDNRGGTALFTPCGLGGDSSRRSLRRRVKVCGVSGRNGIEEGRDNGAGTE